jgi:internalin A
VKLRKILFGWLLLLSTSVVVGQTVSLPDTNLRNKLLAAYPQVMQGTKLVPAKAAALTGTLDLRNSKISNASGIEYFTSVNILDLSNNLLSTIPDISASTGIIKFFANYNLLTFLPDMTALINLQDFQVSNNKLTKLPDLSGASGLKYIYCFSNLLIEFPLLTRFPNLSILNIGDNPFKNAIDYSSCLNLTQLHVHKTGIDTLIGLDKLKKLTMLYAWGNKIRSFSALDSITTLGACYLYDNPITKIPFINNKPGLVTLIVTYCNLTFEDIAPVLQSRPPATFNYFPQRQINFKDISARAGSMYTMSYPKGAPLSQNRYVWLKNGVIIDSSASPSYTFNPLSFSDSGKYALRIYNSSMPSLVLKTDTFKLSVMPCLEYKLSSFDVLNQDCGKGYKIDVSKGLISGGTAPFRFEISNGVYKEQFTGPVFENIPAGNFSIALIDSKKCIAKDHFVLNRIEKCDPVITPNGDGIGDTYFIEKSGKVKIYDLKRNLLNTLDAPVVWDGTDQKGALLDAGYYLMIVGEDAPVSITIIR